jgi:hypothetical protein
VKLAQVGEIWASDAKLNASTSATAKQVLLFFMDYLQ